MPMLHGEDVCEDTEENSYVLRTEREYLLTLCAAYWLLSSVLGPWSRLTVDDQI